MSRFLIKLSYMLPDKEYVIKNSKLKAFAENEKIYRFVLGMMFVFSSVAYCAVIADTCHDSMPGDNKILCFNIIWVVLYILALVVYMSFIGFSPMPFAIASYFVADYTIGSMLSAVYELHFLPVTNSIKFAAVILIAVLYYLMKWMGKNGYVPERIEIKKYKYSWWSKWCDLFFPASGAIIAEIKLIVCYFVGEKMLFLKVLIFIFTVILLAITLLVYIGHFAKGNNLFGTFCSVCLTICIYLLVVGDGSKIYTPFLYSLCDALGVM